MKHIVITGASSGIGLYLSQNLIKQNKVYGLCRKRPNIKNSNFIFIKTNLQNFKNISKSINKIKKADVLINNAGISKSNKKNFLKKFKEILNINLNVPYHLSEALKNKLKVSKNPSIVNICSLSSHLGFPNNPGYVASKGGLFSLTKALAVDYSSVKIRVNSVSPGYIKTKMTAKSFVKKKESKIRIDKTILKRWGKPDDLLGIIEYLISEKSSYVTGQDFKIDGGYTAKGL